MLARERDSFYSEKEYIIQYLLQYYRYVFDELSVINEAIVVSASGSLE